MDENNNLEMVMGEQAVVTPVVDTKKVNQYLAIGSAAVIGAGALYLAYKFLVKPAIAKAKAKKAEVTSIADAPAEEKKEEKE